MYQLDYYLQQMVEREASDLFVSSHLPVSAKINGELHPLDQSDLNEIDALSLVESAMNEKQKQEFHIPKNVTLRLPAMPVVFVFQLFGNAIKQVWLFAVL